MTFLYFLKFNVFNISIFVIKYRIMTLVIDKSNSKNVAKLLTDKLKKVPVKGNLAKHFGKLKRNIDGLHYQIQIRENED